jgi:hypothetical protein
VSWFLLEDTSRYTSATLQFTWNDQGWGNQAGEIYVRKGVPQIDNWKIFTGGIPSPHTPQRLSIVIPPELFGGAIEFGYLVGRGSGHTLTIKEVSLVYVLK